MKHSLAAFLLLTACVAAAAGQQQEHLLLPANAYDPVPSPDGRMVAYLITGRKLHGGSGGLGRSNLQSDVWFCDSTGQAPQNAHVEGFLGEWLPDSSAIVTFRDWRFALAEPGGARDADAMAHNGEDFTRLPERVAYLANADTFLWLLQSPAGTVIQSKNGPFAATNNPSLPEGALIVPSPDERYLAIGSPSPGGHLWVDDTVRRTLIDLGPLTIHPDPEWDYFKPAWNPWSADGRHLAFFSGSDLVLVSPDGSERKKLLHAAHAGLATISPDGTRIAYATFSPRPLRFRKDLSFWGGSTLWIVPAIGGPAQPITKPSTDTTDGLRWLTGDSIVFDRISEGIFNEHARIWTVSVADP